MITAASTAALTAAPVSRTPWSCVWISSFLAPVRERKIRAISWPAALPATPSRARASTPAWTRPAPSSSRAASSCVTPGTPRPRALVPNPQAPRRLLRRRCSAERRRVRAASSPSPIRATRGTCAPALWWKILGTGSGKTPFALSFIPRSAWLPSWNLLASFAPPATPLSSGPSTSTTACRVRATIKTESKAQHVKSTCDPPGPRQIVVVKWTSSLKVLAAPNAFSYEEVHCMDIVEIWNRLPLGSPPFIHPDDRPILERNRQTFSDTKLDFDNFVKSERFGAFEDHRFHLSLLPVPYIGNLIKADIFILLLNPGFDFIDYFAEWRMAEFKSSLEKNLRQDFGS